MSDESYQGWANRETWAFNLHWSNDQGLYNETLEQAKEWVSSWPTGTDGGLGTFIIEYWKNFIDDYESDFGSPLPDELKMWRDEVGSWWRIDETETGASVRESLS